MNNVHCLSTKSLMYITNSTYSYSLLGPPFTWCSPTTSICRYFLWYATFCVERKVRKLLIKENLKRFFCRLLVEPLDSVSHKAFLVQYSQNNQPLFLLQVIKDLKGSDYSWSYQTPPSSPSSSGSRKSSMCRCVYLTDQRICLAVNVSNPDSGV